VNFAVDRFAELLEAAGMTVIRRGEKIDYSCPLHDDRTPSAGATVGERVPVVAHCLVCGEAASLPAVLEELGASESDRDLILGSRPSYNGAVATIHHDYRDPSGALVLRIVRGLDGQGKTRIKPDGGRDITRMYYFNGEWCWPKDLPVGTKPPDTRGLLYNAPAVYEAVRAGGVIHIGEGERVADALIAHGLVATCNVGGANKEGAKPKWTLDHSKQLRGAGKVVVWEDNDEAGRAHGGAEATSTVAVGVADVRQIRFPDLPEKSDVVDYLATIPPEERRARLDYLIENAVRWQLTTVAPKVLEAVSAAELVSMTIPAIESFVGEAALPRGHVSMIHGKGGLGKSYLAIGLGICLASEMAWLGLPTRHARTLMVTYEVPASVAKMQIGEWCNWLEISPPEGFLIVTMEHVITALLEPAPEEARTGPRERLVQLVRHYRADALIVDPWRSCHHAEEKDDRAQSQLLEELKRVAADTASAVEILHHDRKGSPGMEIDDASDASRGSSAIRDAVRSSARLYKAKGALCLEFYKVNLGSKPDPVWLKPRDHAPPEVTDAPEVESARGRKKRKDALALLLRQNPDGLTRAMLVEQLGMSVETVKRYLAELPTRNLRPIGAEGLYILQGGGSDAY
jgi:hypothetical protein